MGRRAGCRCAGARLHAPLACALLAAASICNLLVVAGPAKAAPTRPGLTARGRLASVGGPQIRMRASLAPLRLGRPTAITVGFQITDPPGEALSPLTGMRLLMPAGMSIGASELGLQTCAPAALEGNGPSGCPPDSMIGSGRATAEVPFGAQQVFEQVRIAIFSAPLIDGKPQLLVSATGQHPVIANIYFPGMVLEAGRPFGGEIVTSMPPVPGLPGGPDVGLASMRIAIGPRTLTYSESRHGRTVRFHPAGVILPSRCPRGGFSFEVRLRFMDGASAQARSTVRCPRRGHRRRGRSA